MSFHGKNFIGTRLSALGKKTYFGFDPKAGKPLDVLFHQATDEELDEALNLAADAALALRQMSADAIAKFLKSIATEIEALGDQLIEQASLESGLPKDRLTGERGRTTNQLRMFAHLVAEGSFVDAHIDIALPDRKPVPRPDLRRMLVPIGPVVVFGASNFPLAFSVAGGDTASALASKNPVVVKAHPAHPGTSELVAGAIVKAVKAAGLPEGTFSLVHGVDHQVGMALVQHPAARAIAFTGSERAGRAIYDSASQRPEPIPAYVEMGSTNPVFVLPGALEKQRADIAEGLAKSINLGVGQFCTCPGLVFGFGGEVFADFKKQLATAFEKSIPATMLHPGILSNYEQGLASVRNVRGMTASACQKTAEKSRTEASPVLFSTDVDTWMSHEDLAKEVFGPSAIVVQGQSEDDMLNAAQALPGTLTATVHGTTDDLKKFARLIAVLETKAGRLIFNGYPTGVEVSPAMHHGGPYPATADPKFTSVGTAAILRFLRPVCYQSFPSEALPQELQDGNPRGIWRTVNGEFTRD
jgi:2,5-dioxopentanoate dehydrogenase